MLAAVVTLSFYGTATTAVFRRCPADLRLLSLGTLPAFWISLCGIAGLLDTILGLPAWCLLGVAIAILTFAGVSGGRPGASSSVVVDRANVKQTCLPWWEVCTWLFVISCAVDVGFRAQQLDPWGSWDAMFTWVLRGRYFLSGQSQWRNVFSEDLALLHPDYPPLLGWALSSLWRMDGQETSSGIVGLLTPVWPGFALLVLGWNRVWAGRYRFDPTTAIVIVMPILWKEAAGRLADFAVAYSILGSCAWYHVACYRKSRRALAMAGFLAVWGGLIKNEGVTWGLAFLLVTAGDILVTRRADAVRRWCAILAGASIPLLAIFAFKTILSPSNDLVSPQRSFEIGEIVQPGILINPTPFLTRIWQAEIPIFHRLIWQKIGQIAFDGRDWGAALWWWAALLVLRLRHFRLASPLLLAIAVQIGVYYAVYLVTPYHPYWHLSTSLSRILTHIVPAGLCLTAFGSTRDPKSHLPSKSRKEKPAVVSRPISSRFVDVAGQIYFVAMPACIVLTFMPSDWQLGQQPTIDLAELAAIKFPRVDVASYVTSDLGTRSLYSTQFAAIPTVLVVDRREAILLARFPSEQELLRYCTAQKWDLQQHRGGLGWARDAGGKGLHQSVTLPRIR